MTKRIVLFVEGEGEANAMPKMVKRLLTEQSAWDAVTLDNDVFRVGEVNKLVKGQYHEWKRWLKASAKRKNLGGVLLVLDGDIKKIGPDAFCAATTASSLAKEATSAGAGSMFSVAVVFARQEFESWLIAGAESLAGKRLPDGRKIAADANAPNGDLEESPRNAKGWLHGIIEGGYNPPRDQAGLTDLVDLETVRERGLRSFRRLDSAVSELVSAIRQNKHVATPSANKAES